MDVKNSRWFIEYFNPYEAHMRGVKNYLVSEKTPYQTMDIIESYSFGKCLILDGKTQSTEIDEYIYHDCLVHPAMMSHPDPKRVLIIGGGEGATLREVLKHKNVKEALMIDIDKKVVDLSKKHLPEWHQNCFSDRRCKLLYMDGRKYLERTKDKFDVIIIDISEPVNEGPAYLLFTQEFYSIVKKKLSRDGVIALQAGSTSCREWFCYASIYATLNKVFPVVQMYQSYIPSFDVPWGFAMATLGRDPKKLSPAEVDGKLKKSVKGGTRFYDGETHQGLFILSKDLRKALREQGRVIRDREPIYTEI